jgi:hypothetical protein
MAGVFDHYLVWSDLMKEELLQFYESVSPNQISVAGTPQFEPYVLPRYASSRESFVANLNLDPNRKTICFSCGDISTSKNDELYIETIANFILEGKLSEPVNFVVRTSPAESPERFFLFKHAICLLYGNFRNGNYREIPLKSYGRNGFRWQRMWSTYEPCFNSQM